MGWFSDLLDPGRKSREKMTQLYEQQIAKENAYKEQQIAAANRANAASETYLRQYINSQKGLGQLMYNQGATQLARGAYNQRQQIAKTMANRGITTGVDTKALANTQGYLARGLSALQGQKFQTDAQSAENIYKAGSDTANNGYRNLASAYGNAADSSSTMQGHLNYLQQDANQRSPLAGLIGTAANLYLGKTFGMFG